MDSSQSKAVNLQQMMPLVMDTLQRGGSVSFQPKGTSMLPMLRQGIDSVVLSPLPPKLRKYDIALYRRDNGQYVLHRIVAVGDTYTCLGDNQFEAEPGLRHDQMIALVTAFRRGQKEYSVRHTGYRLYRCLWYRSRHLRRILRRGIAFLRRCLS